MSESTKNKIFWSVVVISIILSIFFTYVRVFINKDYFLVDEVSCDPEIENCFVYTPEDLCEYSDESDCVANTEEEYYKIIHKKAYTIQICGEGEVNNESCPEYLSCEDGDSEEDCFYELCEGDECDNIK